MRFPEPSRSLRLRAETLATLAFDLAAQSDAEACFSPALWEGLQRSGLLMAVWPREHGGDDLLTPDRHQVLFDVLRTVGSGDLSLGRIFEGHVNAAALVCRYGTAEQIRRTSQAVAAGAILGVWGADDAAGLRARREGDGWRLDGRKILASGAGFVTRPVITGMSDEGQIMLLPKLAMGERADASGWTAQGMRATATGSVDFTGMSVDDEDLLGASGDFMRQPHFSGGAWRFCAVHLGAIERLVDLFRAHLTTRHRDTDPFQRQRVAQCALAARSASLWIADVARRMAAGEEAPAMLVAQANLTRGVTERAALDVLEAVHRGVGLSGFLRPHPIERITRDLSTYLRQPVPDLAMSDAAAAILASDRDTAHLWETPREG